MKKTRIVSLLLLVVVCAVALCACQPERQQIAQEDFQWVRVSDYIIVDIGASGIMNPNCYPVEILTESDYKIVVMGDEFQDETSSCVPDDGNFVYFDSTNSSSGALLQGDWGYIRDCDVAFYFLDAQKSVVGCAIVRLYHIHVIEQGVGNIVWDGEDKDRHAWYTYYYGQIVKSVKFTDGPISMEQAQSVVESQLDLPQQPAN